MYKSKIIADSISAETGVRVTSFVISSPLPVHAEFMTHRLFSRNAASSRAIPIDTMKSRVVDDMFLPVFYGMNRKGMQATEEASIEEIAAAQGIIANGARLVIDEIVNPLIKLGLHKQTVNRYMAPWLWIEVLVTGTDLAYHNWFALRDHKDAQPEIRKTATLMLEGYNSSRPEIKKAGQWHMPFAELDTLQGQEWHDLSFAGEEESSRLRDLLVPHQVSRLERAGITLNHNTLVRAGVSAGRSARISYKTFDGQSSPKADMDLFYSLAGSTPKHASPTEHQVLFTKPGEGLGLGGNLVDPAHGLVQFRKLLKNEVTEFDPRITTWHVQGDQLVDRKYLY